MPLTVFALSKGNRMFRLGIGQHDGKWFARLDVWFYAIRIASKD